MSAADTTGATPFCPACGQYLAALPDDHNPAECQLERQAETNRRGVAAAKAELAKTQEDSSDGADS